MTGGPGRPGAPSSSGVVAQMDWTEWHRPYDDPASYLARRLAIVQAEIREALDAAPDGPVPVVSLCAGQGRDLLGVLADHPRRFDVRARLVELDPRNAEVARHRVAELGLGAGIEVALSDAGNTRACVGAVPARLVLVCGVFGNIGDSDIEHTVRALPSLCQPGASVVWTRHRLEPDLTPTIRRWFADAGFVEKSFHAPSDALFGVGTHRLPDSASPPPLDPDAFLFTFVR